VKVIENDTEVQEYFGRKKGYSGTAGFIHTLQGTSALQKIGPSSPIGLAQFSKDTFIVSVFNKNIRFGRNTRSMFFHQAFLTRDKEEVKITPTDKLFYRTPEFEMINFFYDNNLLERGAYSKDIIFLHASWFSESLYGFYYFKKNINVIRFDKKLEAHRD
ncbi:MAG: hypothetical protein AAGC85_20065, partial [Bacteroidota bacterium]